MSAPELELQRLPRWLAGGPYVSDLAYRICVVAVGRTLDCEIRRPRRQTPYSLAGAIPNSRIVDYLVEKLDCDEGDILRALAELQAAGVLE